MASLPTISPIFSSDLIEGFKADYFLGLRSTRITVLGTLILVYPFPLTRPPTQYDELGFKTGFLKPSYSTSAAEAQANKELIFWYAQRLFDRSPDICLLSLQAHSLCVIVHTIVYDGCVLCLLSYPRTDTVERLEEARSGLGSLTFTAQ